MVVDERYKCFTGEAGPVLFDLKEDPQELHNLAGTLPEVEERLEGAIRDWLEATPPVLEPDLRVRAPRLVRAPGGGRGKTGFAKSRRGIIVTAPCVAACQGPRGFCKA